MNEELDIAEVIGSISLWQRTVEDESGETYLLRIRPYEDPTIASTAR